MEQNYGARPSTLTLSELKAKAGIRVAAATRAKKECMRTEIWDAIDEAIKRFIRSGPNRPDT